MKNRQKLAPIAIAVYLFHGIILIPVMSDFTTFGENLKDFFPISVFQNTDLLDYDGLGWVAWLLQGIINIGLIAVAIIAFTSKSNTAPATPTQWGSSSGAGPSTQWGVNPGAGSLAQTPPPPPAD